MNYTLEQLTAAGGIVWEKNSARRVYFNDLCTLFGLERSYYKTGNISSATLDGATISNRRAYEIAGALSLAKVWYDLTNGRFGWTFRGSAHYQMETYRDCITAAIKERIGAAQEAA